MGLSLLNKYHKGPTLNAQYGKERKRRRFMLDIFGGKKKKTQCLFHVEEDKLERSDGETPLFVEATTIV